jgi:hypothetical protein
MVGEVALCDGRSLEIAGQLERRLRLQRVAQALAVVDGRVVEAVEGVAGAIEVARFARQRQRAQALGT